MNMVPDRKPLEPKFHLTTEQNVFVAKRNIVDYIWKSAKLEGLSVTFPETEAIYNGMSVAGLKVDEIVAVNNLKHAWQFLLDTLDYPTDFPYVCELNRIVGANLIYQSGYIRKIPVSIGGTSWKPDLPIEADIREKIAEIMSIESPTERSIALMLYCMRSQMFVDGNKRSSMLAGNHEMIRNGCGIISVPIEAQPEFTKRLVQFYETNRMEPIMEFVYNTCIDGLELDVQEREETEPPRLPIREQLQQIQEQQDNVPSLPHRDDGTER